MPMEASTLPYLTSLHDDDADDDDEGYGYSYGHDYKYGYTCDYY